MDINTSQPQQMALGDPVPPAKPLPFGPQPVGQPAPVQQTPAPPQPQTPSKITIPQYAAKIKAANPKLRSIPDDKLAQIYLTKYPKDKNYVDLNTYSQTPLNRQIAQLASDKTLGSKARDAFKLFTTVENPAAFIGEAFPKQVVGAENILAAANKITPNLIPGTGKLKNAIYDLTLKPQVDTFNAGLHKSLAPMAPTESKIPGPISMGLGVIPIAGPAIADISNHIANKQYGSAAVDLAIDLLPQLLSGTIGKIPGAKTAISGAVDKVLGPAAAKTLTYGEREAPAASTFLEQLSASLPVNIRSSTEFLGKRSEMLREKVMDFGKTFLDNPENADKAAALLKESADTIRKYEKAANIDKALSLADYAASGIGFRSAEDMGLDVVNSLRNYVGERGHANSVAYSAIQESLKGQIKVAGTNIRTVTLNWLQQLGPNTYKDILKSKASSLLEAFIPVKKLTQLSKSMFKGATLDELTAPQYRKVIQQLIDSPDKNFSVDAYTLFTKMKGVVQDINAARPGTISRAVAVSMRKAMRSDLLSGLERYPNILAQVKRAYTGTVAEKQNLAEDFIAKIVNNPTKPTHPEKIVSATMNDPAVARGIMNIVKNDVPTLENLRRKVVQDIVSKTGDNATKALEFLQSEYKGYKTILGAKYPDMVKKFTERAAAYENSAGGAWAKYLKQVSGGLSTEETVKKILSSGGNNFASFTSHNIGSNTDLRNQVGYHVFKYIADHATTDNAFGAPGGLFDPVSFGKNILNHADVLEKFYTPDEMNSMKNFALAMSKFSLGSSGLSSRFATYRTLTSIGYVLTGALAATNPIGSLASLSSITAVPYIFMRITTNPAAAEWLERGVINGVTQKWMVDGSRFILPIMRSLQNEKNNKNLLNAQKNMDTVKPVLY